MKAPVPGSRRALLSRRRLLGGGALAAAGLTGGGGACFLWGERHFPAIYRVRAAVSGLPAWLRGYRIAQVSDMHRGPYVTEEYLRRCGALVDSLAPDLVVATGDFVDHRVRWAESCAAALSGLRAPDGVFAVLGNHDHWSEDAQQVAAALEGAGLRMLTNRSARLQRSGRSWWLCGVDDIWSGRPDLDAALRDVPETGFRILLCHEPDFADRAAAWGIPLQLSGHSHGGQVRLPGCRPFVAPPYGRKYPQGLQQVERSPSLVYTNVGLGVIFPPIRLNCRPEVTLLTLDAARPAA